MEPAPALHHTYTLAVGNPLGGMLLLHLDQASSDTTSVPFTENDLISLRRYRRMTVKYWVTGRNYSYVAIRSVIMYVYAMHLQSTNGFGL